MDSININSRHDRFLLTALFIILFLIFHSPVRAQSWGDIDYDGAPWVDNVSNPYKISRGLYNRHLIVWASHGNYYDGSQA